MKGHNSLIEKNVMNLFLHRDKTKQSDDEFVIETAVKMTIQILHDNY